MASSTEIRAGRAFVELTTKDAALQQGLTRAQQRLSNFAATIGTAGLRMVGFAGAIIAPITLAAQQYAATGARYMQMAARTGLAVTQIAGLEYAARTSGVAVETLEMAVRKMQGQLVAAAGGSYEVQAALARLRLTTAQLANLTPDQQMLKIGDALAKVANPAERSAIAMQIFGGAGAAMLPLLEQGSDAIRKLQERAAALGSQMSEKDARAAAEFNQRLLDLREVTTNLWRTIGAAVLPILQRSTILMTNITNAARRWIDNNRELVAGLFQAAKIIGLVGGVLLGLSIAAKVASFAMGGLSAAATAAGTIITGAFGLILSPIGLIIAAIAGAVAYFVWFTETGRATANGIISFFGRIWDAIKFVFDNTSTLSGAWAALLAEGAFFARDAWAGFKGWFMDLWISLKAWFADFCNSEGWGDAVRKLGAQVLEAWAHVVRAWRDMTNAIADYVWEKFYASDQQKKDAQLARDMKASNQRWLGHKRDDGTVITQADIDELNRKVDEQTTGSDEIRRQQGLRDQGVAQAFEDRLARAKEMGKDLTAEERARRQAAQSAQTEKERAENAAKTAAERAQIEAERKKFEDELAKKHKASGQKSLSDQIKELFKGIEAPDMPDLRQGAVEGMNEAFKMSAPSGTFNPFAAAALQDPRPTRIAAATERTAKATEALLTKFNWGGQPLFT